MRSTQNSTSPCSRVIRPILASRPQPPNSHAEMPAASSVFTTALTTRSCASVRSFTASVCPGLCRSTTWQLAVTDNNPGQLREREAPRAHSVGWRAGLGLRGVRLDGGRLAWDGLAVAVVHVIHDGGEG